MFRSNVLVCGGTGCTSSNSEQIIEKLNEEIKAVGLEKEVNVIRTEIGRASCRDRVSAVV